MPKYKLSLEERTAKQARRDRITTFLSQLDITGIQDMGGLYKEMVGVVLENGLEGELDEELGYSKYDHRNKETSNNRNGHTAKSLKTGNGLLELKVPRDRDGEFEPQLVKKHQSSLSQDIEDKLISLYAKGLSQRDMTTAC